MNRYHLGTVVFAAFILRIMKLIKIITKIKILSPNQIVNSIINFLKNISKFVSCGVFTMCAAHGTDFISSTKNAYHLNKKDNEYVVTLHKVSF